MRYEPPPPGWHEERRLRQGLTRLTVEGFKSIVRAQSIEVRPLTILAGANSSGKSSMMQPLLLLKQTLDASYDPGVLKLDGPNVYFTSANQLFSTPRRRTGEQRFRMGVEVEEGITLDETFGYSKENVLEIVSQVGQVAGQEMELRPDMAPQEIATVVRLLAVGKVLRETSEWLEEQNRAEAWEVSRTRCFLRLRTRADHMAGSLYVNEIASPAIQAAGTVARQTIHVPALRGNPQRTYRRASVTGAEFSGTFDTYVASVISQWQEKGDARLAALDAALSALGLTWGVSAHAPDDTSVELRVGRLPRRRNAKADDMVSIADVGFGVSQVLPVLVALLAAAPDQVVYLEQPELHLHPRAQTVLARLLFDAALRGVRVVAETHSSLLLLGIQTLVAEGRPPELVTLHWFRRDEASGATSVASTDLDASGRFDTDWPEDFAEVTLNAEKSYLNAAEAHLIAGHAS